MYQKLTFDERDKAMNVNHWKLCDGKGVCKMESVWLYVCVDVLFDEDNERKWHSKPM